MACLVPQVNNTTSTDLLNRSNLHSQRQNVTVWLQSIKFKLLRNALKKTKMYESYEISSMRKEKI